LNRRLSGWAKELAETGPTAFAPIVSNPISSGAKNMQLVHLLKMAYDKTSGTPIRTNLSDVCSSRITE
jgi:hypothetical protein